MNRTLRRTAVLLLAVTIAAGPGCAQLKPVFPKMGDVAQQRRRRREESFLRFQGHRDGAELQAARSEWVAGDVDGACERLRYLLDRTPDHVDASLLLAELLLTRDLPDEAVEVLRPAADAHPDNPAVRRTMDLALELLAGGRRAIQQKFTIRAEQITVRTRGLDDPPGRPQVGVGKVDVLGSASLAT